MAIFQVTPEVLAEMLQLPPGAYIDSVHAPHDKPGTLDLRIRGAGWPTRPGMVIMRTTGTITRHTAADGSELRHEIDWGTPPPVSIPP